MDTAESPQTFFSFQHRGLIFRPILTDKDIVTHKSQPRCSYCTDAIPGASKFLTPADRRGYGKARVHAVMMLFKGDILVLEFQGKVW